MYVGRTFMFSLANMQFLHTTDPHVVKELCQCTSLGFGRPSFFWKLFYPLVGDSIGNTNGAVWSQQRKIIAPEFFNNKVKVRIMYLYNCAYTRMYIILLFIFSFFLKKNYRIINSI